MLSTTLGRLQETAGPLDNWRYPATRDAHDNLEVLQTNGGALDNCMYFGQLEVLWRTAGTPDKWRCP